MRPQCHDEAVAAIASGGSQIASRIWALVRPWLASSPARPATWGVAIEVPLRVPKPLGWQRAQVPLGRVEKMPTPGAAASTQLPKLENEALLSLASVAA